MSIEKAIRGRLLNNADLVGIVGTRVYPWLAARSASLPYIVYHVVNTDHEHVQSGSGGWSHTLFQIEAVAKSYGTAKSIQEEVRKSLHGWMGGLAIPPQTTGFQIVGSVGAGNTHGYDFDGTTFKLTTNLVVVAQTSVSGMTIADLKTWVAGQSGRSVGNGAADVSMRASQLVVRAEEQGDLATVDVLSVGSTAVRVGYIALQDVNDLFSPPSDGDEEGHYRVVMDYLVSHQVSAPVQI